MINLNETSDFETVRQDPAAWYRVPQAVLDDSTLTTAEKQSLLDEWAQDLADRSTAADEGMVPETADITDRDIRMQDRVADAQKALAGLAETGGVPSIATRIWRRITGSDQEAAPAKLTE